MKSSLLVAVTVVVAGQVAYHVAARGTPPHAPAYVLIAVAYAVALIVTIIAGVAAHEFQGGLPRAPLVVRGVVLGCAVPLVEIGYIYSYRRGLPISTGPLTVLAISTVVLVPVGLVHFRDHLSWLNVLGTVVAVAGVWLMRM
jgi:hypothetical protein